MFVFFSLVKNLALGNGSKRFKIESRSDDLFDDEGLLASLGRNVIKQFQTSS